MTDTAPGAPDAPGGPHAPGAPSTPGGPHAHVAPRAPGGPERSPDNAALPACIACGAPTVPWTRVAPAAGEADPFHQASPGGRVFGRVDCPECGLLQVHPVPTDEELTAVYRDRYDYAWFHRRRFLKGLQARHRWRRIAPRLEALPADVPRRLLDVGAGQGDFLRAARAAGWEAHGQDPALPDEAPPEGPYGLVTFWHALEHLRDPRAALGHAARRLAPGGLLVVAVPNRAARGLEAAGRHWGWLQEPFIHLWMLTPRALSRLLPPVFEPPDLHTREAWDQQTWFASRLYGRLTNRAPASWIWWREALHLAGFAAHTVRERLGGNRPGTEPPLDRPELVLVARRGK